MRKIAAPLIAFALWAIICFTYVSCAHAQAGGWINSGRTETDAQGRYATMWNATGVTITDGTLVMVDTVAATSGPQIPMGKGFKTWSGDAASSYRVAGILIGDTPGYDKGRVLIEGFHPNALMAATGLAGWTRLTPSLTVAGALDAYADADTANAYKKMVGSFQRYAPPGNTLRGYVWVKFGAFPRK